jgi:hypothetical protein
MVLNIIAIQLNNNLTTKNLKKNSLKTTKKLLTINLMKSSNGWEVLQMLNYKNMKLNKKKWKEYGTQSCKEFTKLWADNQVECQVVCQEECQVECQEVCQEECQVVWEECQVEWEEWDNNNQKPQM